MSRQLRHGRLAVLFSFWPDGPVFCGGFGGGCRAVVFVEHVGAACVAEVCAEVVQAVVHGESVGREAVACGVVAVLQAGSFAHDGGFALPVFGHQGACACVLRHGGKEGRECWADAHEAHLARFGDGWADVYVFCAVRLGAYVFPGEAGEFFGADAGEEEDGERQAGVGAVEAVDGGHG